MRVHVKCMGTNTQRPGPARPSLSPPGGGGGGGRVGGASEMEGLPGSPRCPVVGALPSFKRQCHCRNRSSFRRKLGVMPELRPPAARHMATSMHGCCLVLLLKVLLLLVKMTPTCARDRRRSHLLHQLASAALRRRHVLGIVVPLHAWPRLLVGRRLGVQPLPVRVRVVGAGA